MLLLLLRRVHRRPLRLVLRLHRKRIWRGELMLLLLLVLLLLEGIRLPHPQVVREPAVGAESAVARFFKVATRRGLTRAALLMRWLVLITRLGHWRLKQRLLRLLELLLLMLLLPGERHVALPSATVLLLLVLLMVLLLLKLLRIWDQLLRSLSERVRRLRRPSVLVLPSALTLAPMLLLLLLLPERVLMLLLLAKAATAAAAHLHIAAERLLLLLLLLSPATATAPTAATAAKEAL